MTARLREWVIYMRARSAALLFRLGIGMTPMAMGDREPTDPATKPDSATRPATSPQAQGQHPVPLPTQPTTLAGKTPAAASTEPTGLPRLAEFTHYESSGHPDGRPKECKPGLVVGIVEDSTAEELDLAVFLRTGITFERCRHDENRIGGTWHWSHE